MSDTITTDALFFGAGGLDQAETARMVDHALDGSDDGELFLEYRQSESFSLDDGRIRGASFDTTQGFGLRAVSGEAVGFAHASTLDQGALKRAVETVRAVRGGASGTVALPPAATNRALYTPDNPLDRIDFTTKVETLSAIDAHARSRDPKVVQVMASLTGSWQAVRILGAGGRDASDLRPLVRLNVSVVVEGANGRRETGSHGLGGRVGYDGLLEETTWKAAVEEALRQALVNLESIDAPAGEMPVVLGPGWPGILLHEAIGHGLEGDGNRKGTSAFSEGLGKRVAAPGVTIVDDGTIADRRGSLSIDDEGTPTARTVIIEDGILTGYLQDRLNARLMGMKPTGNGRRQSYAHHPLPRMTNTFMLAGADDPAAILGSVKRGLYAVNFGGGQVDTTSGKFVFSASEAYLIENGRIGAPVKGATLIGNGPDVLTRVSMVGNDLALDPGIGTCGKEGQGVPVGVGQPTLKVDSLTVGGTAVAA
ncbi:metalloprotease TldD [Rhodospirillum rubrum]|uniref:metalloprotease TldD n=1 Tax=Rhodospirillum rubrum TaxID=1085 RepID=UPI001904C46C|nr:metalloprotease TldD [Rhodospirillum rubrum]MBK1664251.1 metalloprotease TldD [Rhodospirillum rubrum]MBK1675331.1 metalloprotease TldD [Rhodospirillum rubrum]